MIYPLIKYVTAGCKSGNKKDVFINLDDDFVEYCLSCYRKDKEKQILFPDGEWLDLTTVSYVNSILPFLKNNEIFKEKIQELFFFFDTFRYYKDKSLYDFMVLKNRIDKDFSFMSWIDGYDSFSAVDNNRHIYDAYQVNLLIKAIKNPVVLEIGGGYGGFAYHLLKHNKNVKYINIDVPEIQLLCRYYLLSNFKDCDIAFVPIWDLDSVLDDSVDVVVNCHSLSEMAKETVDNYCVFINRVCKGFFYCVNSRFPFVSNGHVEIPYTEFGLDGFRLLRECKSVFSDGRHFECLYMKKQLKKKRCG